jgi:hypothetical protein
VISFVVLSTPQDDNGLKTTKQLFFLAAGIYPEPKAKDLGAQARGSGEGEH